MLLRGRNLRPEEDQLLRGDLRKERRMEGETGLKFELLNSEKRHKDIF